MSNAWAGSADMRWLSLREQRTQSGRSPLRETTPATNVPNFMVSGTFLNRWEEESSNIQDCFLKVDAEGFFVTYQDADKDAVTIDMCHVSDCRSGLVPKDARIREFLDSMAQEALEDRSITIFFGSSLAEVSALHFVSTSSKIIKDWIEGINDLALRRPFANPSVLLLLRKQHARIKSMVNAHGKIPVRNIVKCMSCSKFEQRLAEGLQGLDLISGKNDYVEPSDFTIDKFYKLYEFLCPRQDLDTVFSKRCTGKTRFLTVQHLVQFLNDEQRDPRLNEILHPYWNVEKTAGLVREFEPAPALAQKDCLSIEGWTRFLMSEHNVALKPSVLALHQEMSHPLSHYFIHSSHNTYLIGRQFGGKSSVEMYRQCLLAGCRCIELDCWDGPGDEPIITHGKAMCTNILFKDVIYAIKETAFVTSPFPLILSFENHCLRLQQRKLASYCIEIFGDLLLTKNLDDWPLEKGKELPPPNKLMYKILIKNKKLRADIELSGFTYDCDSADGADGSNEDAVKAANSGEDQERGDGIVDGLYITGSPESLPATSTPPEPTESSKLRPPPPQKRLSVISEQSLSTDNADPSENTLRDKKDSESLSSETVEEDENGEQLAVTYGSCDDKETTDTIPTNGKDDCDANGNNLKVLDNSYRFRAFTEGVQRQAALTQVVSHMSGMSTQKADGMRRVNKGKLSRLQRSASFEEPCSENLCNGQASKNEGDNDEPLESTCEIADSPSEQDISDDAVKVHLRRKLVTNTNRARLLREQTLEKSLSISMDSLPKGKESLSKTSGRNVSIALDLAEDSPSSSLRIKRKKRFTHSRSSSGDSNSTFGGEDRFQEPMRKSTATVSNVTLSGSGNDTEYEGASAVDEERPRKETRSSSHGSVSSQTSISGSKSHKKNSRTASLSAEDESEMMVGYPAATKNIDPLLSSLVNYIQPTAFPGFEEAEEQDLSFKMSSFNETSAYQLVRSSPVEFARYNKKQLSRIYPKGTRVDSTNYNPQVFWNVGCQMVSLNLQTTDLAFQLNQGKFEVNGQSGYILKPEVLRRPNKVFDPFMESPIDNVEASSVSVKVISGQFLTDKKCSTYVVVDMYGLPADTKRKNKTKLAGSTFMNTLYNEESFVFNKVVLSELALLRFAVYDENDKLLGQRVLPLDGIQPGYRHIPLRSEANVPLTLPTLFVYITVKTYVPEKFLLYIDGLVEPMKYQSNLEQRDETLKLFDDEDDAQSEDSAPSLSMAPYRVPSLSVLQSTSISIEHQRQTRSESTLTLSMPAKMQGGMRSVHNTSTANLHLIVHNGEVKLLETMSAESIKRDKNYQKILKKHQKEKDNLHRRHDKERTGQSRQHESQVEKIKSVYVKTVLAEERALEKTLRKIIDESRKEELKQQHQQKIEFMERHQNEKLDELNKQHTTEVEVTRARQTHEEAGLRCYQAVVEVEYLRRLLHSTQEQELKQMKESQEMGRLELQREQTRQSMEGTRELNLDRNIKSKEERERLQRELNKNNVERFKQERENLRKRQESDLEELVQKQQQVSKAMEEEFQQLLDGEKQKYRDATIKKRKTCLF